MGVSARMFEAGGGPDGRPRLALSRLEVDGSVPKNLAVGQGAMTSIVVTFVPLRWRDFRALKHLGRLSVGRVRPIEQTLKHRLRRRSRFRNSTFDLSFDLASHKPTLPTRSRRQSLGELALDFFANLGLDGLNQAPKAVFDDAAFGLVMPRHSARLSKDMLTGRYRATGVARAYNGPTEFEFRSRTPPTNHPILGGDADGLGFGS